LNSVPYAKAEKKKILIKIILNQKLPYRADTVVIISGDYPLI